MFWGVASVPHIKFITTPHLTVCFSGPSFRDIQTFTVLDFLRFCHKQVLKFAHYVCCTKKVADTVVDTVSTRRSQTKLKMIEQNQVIHTIYRLPNEASSPPQQLSLTLIKPKRTNSLPDPTWPWSGNFHIRDVVQKGWKGYKGKVNLKDRWGAIWISFQGGDKG